MDKQNQLNKIWGQIPNDFSQEKAKVMDYLAREEKKEVGIVGNQNSGLIDTSVKELVIKFNELPFLYTTSSGAGHLLTCDAIIAQNQGVLENMLQLPPRDKAFHVAGHLMFNINETPKSKQFIADLQSFLTSKFKDKDIVLLEQTPISFRLQFGKSLGLGSISDAEKLKQSETDFKKELSLFVSA